MIARKTQHILINQFSFATEMMFTGVDLVKKFVYIFPLVRILASVEVSLGSL